MRQQQQQEQEHLGVGASDKDEDKRWWCYLDNLVMERMREDAKRWIQQENDEERRWWQWVRGTKNLRRDTPVV